ncbi:MAG: FadR/GntR family transcriptional regulator [Thermodesulfobacteriota bacterium]
MNTRPMHRKLYEYVVEEIGLQIMRGDVAPGDTLPNEDALCRQYGVSRGVLREATKVLTQKGLIRTQPKVGTRIQPRENWNLFDADVLLWKLKVGDRLDFLKNVTEVRCIIESEAARYAAQRADAKEIKRIRARYEQLADTLADAKQYDYDTYLESDMAFHAAILNACRNDLLAQIGYTMRQAVHTARKADIHDIDTQRESLPFHLSMLEAIAARDAEKAYQASQAMFNQVWEHLPA